MNQKRLALVLIIMLMIFTFASLLRGPKQENQVSAQNAEQEYRRQANNLVRGLIYVKDPRTGLCFAFNPPSSARGGSIALVPEDQIPKKLLIVAENP